jgi:uncharacterized protein (TIGR03089 family)
MYDLATGERVELSVATFDNWVSKLANLFSAEWGLEPADSVEIALPAHWQAMVTAMAAWTAGLRVRLGASEDAVADARVVGPGWSGDREGAQYVLACSLRPLGGRFLESAPAGALDWADEVPPQPDVLLLPQPVSGMDIALVTAAETLSHRDLVERGRAAAARIGLRAGGRLLTALDPVTPDGLEVALLAPLTTGSSVVLVVNGEPERTSSIAEQERVTCVA